MRFVCWIFISCTVVFAAGCSGAGDEGPTQTEKVRQSVSPKVGTFLLKAQRAYKHGVYNAALMFADSAKQHAPELTDIPFLQARIYTELKQVDRANRLYKQVLSQDSLYQGAWLNLGINQMRQGDLRDALKSFKKEQAHYPTASVWLEVGRAYAKLGKSDSARKAYAQSIQLDSTNATALMWMGQLLEEMGEMEKAVEYSRQGLALAPDDRNYQYIIGSQLSRLGQEEEAAEYLQPVAEAWPWHHGAQYNLGQALMRLGQEEQANHYLERADSAQTMHHEVEKISDAIEGNPQNGMKWVEMGDALRKVGRIEEAVDAYQVAASLMPRNLGLQSNLANLVSQKGDLKDAAARYRAILRVDPSLADVWLNLGVVYAQDKRMDRARKAWKQALQHEPGHPKAQAYLAKLASMQER